MLRLERVRRGPSITIRMREKDSTFDRPFVRALAAAAALHLAAFLIVTVAPAPNDDHLSVLVPSNVDIELGYVRKDFQAATLPAAETDRGVLPRYMIEPEPPSPSLPSMPTSNVVKDVAFDHRHKWCDEPFKRLEQPEYAPDDVILPFEDVRHPVNVSISGTLSDRTLIDDGRGIAARLQAPKASTEQTVLHYAVKVDDSSGTIFWWEQVGNIEQPVNREARQLIVKILEGMRFQPIKDKTRGAFITEGTIELILEVDATNNDTSAWQQVVSVFLDDPQVGG